MSDEVKIWISKEQVDGSIPGSIADAIATLRGELAECVRVFRSTIEFDRHDGLSRAKNQVDTIERMVITQVAQSIAGEAERTRRAMDRESTAHEFGKSGSVIADSFHGGWKSGIPSVHLWFHARENEGQVVVSMHLYDSDDKIKGVPDIEVGTFPDFAAAYDWMTGNNTELKSQMAAMAEKAKADLAVVNG